MARMSLSDILFLYRARLRARAVLVQEAFAVVGISIGVALLFASQVASTSLTHSVQQLTNQVVGRRSEFQLDARGPAGVDGAAVGGGAAHSRGANGAAGAGSAGEPDRVRLAGGLWTCSGPPRALPTSGGPLLRHFSDARLAKSACHRVAGAARRGDRCGCAGTSAIADRRERCSHVGRCNPPGSGYRRAGQQSRSRSRPVAYVQHLAGMGDRITQVFVEPVPGRDSRCGRRSAKLAATAGVNLEPADFDSTLFRGGRRLRRTRARCCSPRSRRSSGSCSRSTRC